MSSIQEELDKLNKEASDKVAEAARLTRLVSTYPDLQKHVGRWNKVAYSSASVNSKVTKLDFRHNCGCCLDSPLELWLYLETPDGNIYSNPPYFTVGEKHNLGGDRPYPGWEKELRAAGIPEVVVASVHAYFRHDRNERIKAVCEDIEDPPI
jgi:hypothetical protein